MSHTDKDCPWRVDPTRPSNWREKGSGPKGVRLAKKEARRARRRGITDPRMVKSLTQTTIYTSA